ncbi:MAG: hypothetical protein RR137_06360 [Odoribacter sp.]
MLKCFFIVAWTTFCFSAAGNNCLSTDSLQQDTSAQASPFFRRIYENVYQYFIKANEDDHNKRFDFSIIGGPHFSSDTKLGLGLVASGIYRVDRQDFSIPPSNISFYGDVTTTGFYLLGIRGTTIFPQNKYRLGINLYFFSFPSQYWGIGYDRGSKDDDYTTYKRLEKQIRIDFSRKILNNTYIGITTLFRHVNGKDLKNIHFLDGEKNDIATLGFGAFLTYDSRDFLPNPYRGTYAKIEQIIFPDIFGNAFKRTEILSRHYNKLWKGCILASELQGIFNYGDTPWSMVALLGGSYQMRGYYEGQYRDNDLIQTQIELRQHIYHRHGIALWAGAGNIFPKFDQFKWKETLPTYGIGYRWEFKKRVNVRLDYGFGKRQSAFYFNIDEAF